MRGAPLDHERLDTMSQVGVGVTLVAGVVPTDAAVTAAARHSYDKTA
jgi:hypothetical protein